MKTKFPGESKQAAAALAEFDRAEASLTRNMRAYEDAAQRLLKARMDHAATAREADRAARDLDAQSDFEALALQKTKAQELAHLLEAATAAAAQRVALSKVAVLAAERACLQAQATHFQELLADLLKQFAQENAPKLQHLIKASNAAGFFALSQTYGHDIAADIAQTNVHRLVADELADAAWSELGTDEAFIAGCGASEERIAGKIQSSAVSSAERSAAEAAIRAGTSPADALLALAEPAHEASFDLTAAMAAAREAARRAEAIGLSLADVRRKRGQRPQDPSLHAEELRLAAQAQHADAVVASWDERIERHHAGRLQDVA